MIHTGRLKELYELHEKVKVLIMSRPHEDRKELIELKESIETEIKGMQGVSS